MKLQYLLDTTRKLKKNKMITITKQVEYIFNIMIIINLIIF